MVTPSPTNKTHVFSLTDRAGRSHVKNWNFTYEPSQTSDERLHELVKLLARYAAEKDFEAMIRKTNETLH